MISVFSDEVNNSQRAVAVGIKDARTGVNQMNAAITTPDATLSSNIADAVQKVGTLQAGGQGVLTAEVRYPPSLAQYPGTDSDV